MATVPELILTTLEELKDNQLSKFQWFLYSKTLESCPHIPRSWLEGASRTDTVDILVETYGNDDAVTVTLDVLTRMKLKLRAETLKEDYDKVPRSQVKGKGEVDLKAVQEKLKSTLKKKYQNIYEGNTEEGYNIYLKKIYTELHIIEGGLCGTMNEIAIKASDIFKPRLGQDKLIRTVLTLGIPGVGKTVCAQKYALSWAEGEENQDIVFLFLIPFRELNPISDESYSLMQLLHQFFPEMKAMKTLGTDCKVLFIFDGLDETGLPLDFKHNKVVRDETEAAPLDVLMTNLITGDLLNGALIWITSRPAAANSIPRKHVQQWTEVKGFTAEKMEEYFRKRLPNENSANKIISHVKSSKSLYAMCQIPVFCSITVTVVTNTHENSKGSFPSTLTEMYGQLLRCQTDKLRDNIKEISSVVLKLAELAFRQLKKGKLIFYESDLKESGIDIKEAAVYSGVCTEVFKMEGRRKREVFMFVHLTVQEFLAAVFAHYSYTQRKQNVFLSNFKRMSTKLLPKSLFGFHKMVIEKALESSDGHWDLFLRFLLGLSLSSNQELLTGIIDLDDLKEETSRTIAFIKQKIKENPEPSMNLFHCLSELKDESLVQEIQGFVNAGRLTAKNLSPVQWSALNFDLMTSEATEEFDLKKYVGSEEGVINLRAVITSSTRALLDHCNLSEKCCEVLASTLNSSASRLKELDLSDNNIKDSGLKLLCEGLRSKHCKLEILRLLKCKLNGECGKTLAEVLSPDWTRLRLLDLSINDLHEAGLKALCVGLCKQHCRLQTLRLNQCKLNDKCGADLASVLTSGSSGLKELELSNNSLKDSGLTQLSAGLMSPHCSLETLRLSCCELTQKSCSVIGSALSSDCSRLKELDLSGNNLRNIQALCVGLKSQHCKLETLRLKECNLQKCCQDMASVFSCGSSEVKELDLSGNDLLDSEVQLLCAGLSRPGCKLEILRLSFCGVTEKSCTFLASVLGSGVSQLKVLDLSYNHLQDSGVELLSIHRDDPLCKFTQLSVEPDGECYLKSTLKKYGCELTLNTDTASKSLFVYEGGKQVTRVRGAHPYRDHPERFESVSQVLCHQGLTQKHYWEVEWTGRWVDIAVAMRGIRRRASPYLCGFGTTDQSWSLFCSEDQYSAQHDRQPVDILAPRGASRRIGVYLDWPAGTLSFYCVSAGTLNHLYTFHSSFTEPLYPGFGMEQDDCSVTIVSLSKE